MVQLSCPDATRWRALLADSAADAPELESHLATCVRCRELLDDLAVGSSGWLRDAGRLAADTDRDPEITRTLHRLRDALADDHPDPPVPLDFLTPSDQPGILGTLGRYQVLEVIGRGAMGIVLKALDPDLLRPVAVKVLAPYLAPSGTARERFKREARAAAAVSHDHVVTIHAVEEANGLPFFVMEYVTGVSLQGRLDRDGPLPPRDIARIGHQAACGLAAAHEQGLVHRDIKPANILLENGVERVKLTDFGLARAADDARLTQSGVAAGTPLYMSPEQARGEAVDARSDLFSLGSVLYTLATGFPPFRAGSAMGVLHRITNDPPRRIRETIPDFPPALEAIIMQLLDKNPGRRIPSAAEVANRLTEFLAASSEVPKPRRWWPVVVGLALAAALLVTAVILTFRTTYGTLVVEIYDPSVKVALDGNELTITGAGTQEVRLKPGAYRVTATPPPGKTAKVSPEVVKIEKDGKAIVTVTVELDPSLPSPVPRLTAEDTDALFEDRVKAVLKDPVPARLELMRYALKRALGKPAERFPSVMAPETHPQFATFGKNVLDAAKADTPPDRVRLTLESAYLLAGTIVNERPAPNTVAVTKDGPKKMDPEWEAKLDPLMKQFQDLTRRLAGTPAGGLILLPGLVADLDKAVAGVREADRDKVKRLLALRDQFALLIPKAQAAAIRLHELKDLVANNFRTSIRESLEEMHKGLLGYLRDMEKVAAELGAKPYRPDVGPDTPGPEADFRKVIAEYDAIVLRLTGHRVGRVLTLVGPNWDHMTVADRGFDATEIGRATKLLRLRDEIRAQKFDGEKAIRGLDLNRVLQAKNPSPESQASIDDEIRLQLADLKVRTETIRGLMADLKDLADVLDPPEMKADPLGQKTPAKGKN